MSKPTHLEHHVGTLAECALVRRVDRCLLGEFGVKLRNVILTAERWAEGRLLAASQHICPRDLFEERVSAHQLTICRPCS